MNVLPRREICEINKNKIKDVALHLSYVKFMSKQCAIVHAFLFIYLLTGKLLYKRIDSYIVYKVTIVYKNKI